MDVFCDVKLSPVVFELSAAIHENVEGMLDVNGRLIAMPLHIVAVAELVVVGAGFTVTVTV